MSDDDLGFSDLEENSDGDSGDEFDRAKKRFFHPDETESADDESNKKASGQKHLKEMKSLLGLDTFKDKQTKKRERKKRANKSQMVQTIASKVKATPMPEVVQYQDPRKKKLKKQEERKRKLQSEAGSTEEITMKDARLDVFKLGVSGLDKAEKADVEMARLISLGAKPLKKKCIDYKEFKEMRIKEKQEERRKKEEERLSGIRYKNMAKMGKVKAGKKTKPAEKATSKKKVGKFDGGMLRLSAKDIAAVRNRK